MNRRTSAQQDSLTRLLSDEFADAEALKRALRTEAARADRLYEALAVAASRMEVAAADWSISGALALDKLTYAHQMREWSEHAREALT